jgi:hypothetical protein
MSDLNDEMKLSAENAITQAKERFGQDLDFSERSIAKLDNILVQIYWYYSNRTEDKEDLNSIFSKASIWGSYLGEYMRLKWGGTWILSGSGPLISIKNIKFSPISLVNLKIWSHPESRVENYLLETNRIINSAILTSQKSGDIYENTRQEEQQVISKGSKKSTIIDRQLLITLAVIDGILLVTLASIIGYIGIRNGSFSAFGLILSTTLLSTNTPTQYIAVTATPVSSPTQSPTITTLPTYTPKPSNTPHRSSTPNLALTQIASFSLTDTQNASLPTQTVTSTKTLTFIPFNPTNTREPPPQPRQPTDTQPPPVVIESCEVDPSIVPIGFNVTITYIVHFSTNIPGYGFDTLVDPKYPGQSGCSGVDSDGDGIAYCDGSSGELPASTSVSVTITTSIGDCNVSYSSR